MANSQKPPWTKGDKRKIPTVKRGVPYEEGRSGDSSKSPVAKSEPPATSVYLFFSLAGGSPRLADPGGSSANPKGMFLRGRPGLLQPLFDH